MDSWLNAMTKMETLAQRSVCCGGYSVCLVAKATMMTNHLLYLICVCWYIAMDSRVDLSHAA